MCGRFANYTAPAHMMEEFQIDELLSANEASYNITPGTEISVIVFQDNKKLIRMKWGFVPSWVKDAKYTHGQINARGETVNVKPFFRTSFKRRRCLIIADGFYEWKKIGREKIPVFIRLKNGKPFTMAGIYDFFTTEEGKTIGSCAIITTESNALMRDIHDRMPVIIRKEDHGLWLDAASDEQLLLPFIKPFPDEEMELFEVSKDVNSPKNDGPELIMKPKSLF